MEMGFGKEETVAALKASNNNIDLAIEYLFNGMP